MSPDYKELFSKNNIEKERSSKILNILGYGRKEGGGKELKPDFVYNPSGPFLPSSQKELEKDCKNNLEKNMG